MWNVWWYLVARGRIYFTAKVTINTSEYLRSYSSLSAISCCTTVFRAINNRSKHPKIIAASQLCEVSPEHEHPETQPSAWPQLSQEATLCTLSGKEMRKNRKWLLAIVTTKETRNHQLYYHAKKFQCFSVEDIDNQTYKDLPALWVPVKREEWPHNGLWDDSHRRQWALWLCRKRDKATEIKFFT